jgi:hypothetical protein
MTDTLFAGGEGKNGRITARGNDDLPLAELIAGDAEAVVAAGQSKGRPGRLTLYDGAGATAINVTAANAHAVVGGGSGNGRVTAAGKDGRPLAELIAADEEAIIAAGGPAPAGTKAKGRGGRLTLYDGKGNATMNMISANAHAVVGGGQVPGRITAAGADGQPVVELIAAEKEAVVGAGQLDRPARVSLYDGKQKETIRLDAAAGDIILFNADCAEEFDVDGDVVAGAVVVLGDDGVARCCRRRYDSRVLGVVSGAGGFRPAILFDHRDTGRRRAPVSLMGKVMCLVEAENESVRTGDLLTTSAVAGYAMRADRREAFGAVIGKALAPLRAGRALLPVVVSLQ